MNGIGDDHDSLAKACHAVCRPRCRLVKYQFHQHGESARSLLCTSPRLLTYGSYILSVFFRCRRTAVTAMLCMLGSCRLAGRCPAGSCPTYCNSACCFVQHQAAIFVQLDNVIFRVYMCVCLKRFVHGKHSFQRRVALIEGVRGRHRSSGPAPVARSRSPRHSAGPGRVERMSVNDVEIAPRAFHIIFHDNVSRRVFPAVP